MSLQQNNINKFPKHIQHVRLQKEEDEEQWISGEELCTEGSSDEENTNDIKKKIKSKPLNTPSKELIQIKNPVSSTSLSTRESDEESMDTSESTQKSPTQWRPKRGSIKLPNIEETKWKLHKIQNERLNTEYEYQEAMKILKTCKNELTSNEHVNFNEESNNDAHLITSLDDNLLKIQETLEDCKRDRQHFQNAIYNTITTFSNTMREINNTQKFHDVFKIKSDAQIAKVSYKTNKNVKSTPVWKKKPKYIPHRKRKMNENLNEEEQARLKELLSDIDITEIDEIEVKNDEEETSLPIDLNYNAFKKTEEETRNLQEIEQKLKTLQETCDDADLKGKSSEEIHSIDEDNREWKTYKKLIEGRFQRINEKINKLHEEDETTVKEDVQNT